jgi:hypothetical protein
MTIFTKQDIEAAAKAYFEAPKYRDGDKGFRAMTAALNAAENSLRARRAMSGDGAAWESSFGWVFHELQPLGKEHPAVIIILDKEAP